MFETVMTSHYLKNCVIITHCFFKACSILYYFLFWKGTHTFSNENHRDTWGRGLNHDSPVCVCMSFRSDLVWKTLNGENWTKSSSYFSLHLRSWVLRVQNIAVFDIQFDLLCHWVISVWLRSGENLNFISYPFDEI